MKKTKITIQTTSQIKNSLVALAGSRGLTLSAIVNNALHEYLQKEKVKDLT